LPPKKESTNRGDGLCAADQATGHLRQDWPVSKVN
jgi:hypothetical protein